MNIHLVHQMWESEVYAGFHFRINTLEKDFSQSAGVGFDIGFDKIIYFIEQE